jgi:hypothetical protein
MTCRYCQARSEGDVCRVCQFLAAPPQTRRLCGHCSAPIANPGPKETLCQLCADLLQTLRNRVWFARAHMEWEEENTYLARRKMELLGHGGLIT